MATQKQYSNTHRLIDNEAVKLAKIKLKRHVTIDRNLINKILT